MAKKYRFRVLAGSHSEGERQMPENPDVVMKLRSFDSPDLDPSSKLQKLYEYGMQLGVDLSKCETVEQAKELLLLKTRTGPIIKYGKNSPHGDVVETDTELDKLHNGPGDKFKKFERLLNRNEEIAELETRLKTLKEKGPESEVRSAVANSAPIGEHENDALDGMSINDLRQHAAEVEVDLGNARTKAEIIAKIREQMAPVA